jgi:hypothetical protein
MAQAKGINVSDIPARAKVLFEALEGSVAFLTYEIKPQSFRRVARQIQQVIIGDVYRGRSRKKS